MDHRGGEVEAAHVVAEIGEHAGEDPRSTAEVDDRPVRQTARDEQAGEGTGGVAGEIAEALVVDRRLGGAIEVVGEVDHATSLQSCPR